MVKTKFGRNRKVAWMETRSGIVSKCSSILYTLQQRSFPLRETAERRIKWLLSTDCVETYRLQQRKVKLGEKVRNGETGLDICKCLSARRPQQMATSPPRHCVSSRAGECSRERPRVSSFLTTCKDVWKIKASPRRALTS